MTKFDVNVSYLFDVKRSGITVNVVVDGFKFVGTALEVTFL